MAERPSVLVLDLGGVTCRWLPDRRLVELGHLSGMTPETVDRLVFQSGFDDAAERGRFTLDAFVEELTSVLGLAAGSHHLHLLRAAWATAYEPDPAVISLTSAVRADGVPTAIFTNNGPLMEAAMHAELAEVGAAFDVLLFSWRLGHGKPDEAAFAAATEALGVEPHDVFFADDAAANAEAADAFGWRAHRFTTALDLQVALRAAGLG